MTNSNSWYRKEYLLGLGGLGGGAGGILVGGGPISTSGDDAYTIEKSVKFYEDDISALKRSPTFAGNRRKWTWAAWVKRSKFGDHQNLFSVFNGPTDNTGYIDCCLHTTDQLRIGGWTTLYLATHAVFRDPSAWYHIVVAVDTTHDVDGERVKFYVNGVRHLDFDTQNQPAQNTIWPINHNATQSANAYNHGYGGNIYYGTASQKLNGYLADVHFIDGQTLSPAAFGSFDSAKNWNPKTLAIPNPNTGVTWSNYLKDTDGGGPTLTDGASYPLSYCFDGDSTRVGAMSYANGMVFTPPDPIPFSSSVEVLLSSSIGAGTQGYIATISGTEQLQVDLAEGAVYRTIYSGSGTLDKLVITRNVGGSNNNLWIYGIRIDGVTLIDGLTDPTTRNNLNDGTAWSQMLSVDSGSVTNASQAFNGNLSGDWANSSGNGGILTFTPTGTLPYKHGVRVWLRTHKHKARIN